MWILYPTLRPLRALVSIAPRSGYELHTILLKIRYRICPAPEHSAGPEPSERHVLALVKGDPMNPFSNVPRRIVVTVIASALVLVVAAATALGQTRSSEGTRLAVGNPSVRPRPSPSTTVPSSRKPAAF